MEEFEIKQFVVGENDTNMYLIMDMVASRAILIDPVSSVEVANCLEKHSMTLEYIMITHEHYDHISALNEIRQEYKNVSVISSKICSERMKNPSTNLSKYFNLLLEMKSEKFNKKINDIKISEYITADADCVFEEYKELEWGKHTFKLWKAPGHSAGGCLIGLDDRWLFSGDTVSYDFELITRYPGGSKKDYEGVTKPILQSFNGEIEVLPGHGRKFLIKEVLI